jgi:NADPH2:quinone reductase
MPEAIIIREFGGSKVLRLENIASPLPEPNEMIIRQTAVGINFHDIYCRSGLYKSTFTLPKTPGVEGVGIVTKLGSYVDEFNIGDKVAYITSKYNGYSSERTLPSHLAVRVPDGIDDEIVAASFLKGLTVQMLCKQVTQVKANDRVLVHAAAGGVGQLLVQTLKNMGAIVIGTVGSEAKAKIAKETGCDHVILYREENVLEEVMNFTDSAGLNIVYDSVGKDTFHDSLASLTFRGHLVNFGQASGPIEGFEIPMLAKKSISLTRPMLFHYTQDREKLLEMSKNHFQSMMDGKLKVSTPIILPLKDAAKAHDMLASRLITQPVVLIP